MKCRGQWQEQHTETSPIIKAEGKMTGGIQREKEEFNNCKVSKRATLRVGTKKWQQFLAASKNLKPWTSSSLLICMRY